jgi:hypothetical protein
MPNDISTLFRYFADQCQDSDTQKSLFREVLGSKTCPAH